MAYTTNELFGLTTRSVEGLRALATEIQPKTFAPVTGGATLERLTPVAFDTNLSKWVVWSALSREEEVQTVTIAAGTSGGTFTLSFEGQETGNIDWDATAAELQAALEALPNINEGDISVSLASGVYTITFLGSGQYGYQDVEALVADATNLTGDGNEDATVAEGNAGVADTGRSEILGFVWPDAITLDDSGVGNKDVLGQVMLAGKVHYDDIVLPDGEDEDDLKAALRSGPRKQGLWIEGLDQVR